ncbi:MAG TPA: hypothetical protein VIE43_14865 [Thermoanaerobaculia bacterium]|nr:hypothetical protein [Thermoanaerobaculia bacterium]
MTWLVFYPRTMWRVVVHPAAMTLYSEDKELDEAAEAYTDRLSPLLLLMLTLLIAHGFELGLGLKMPAMESPIGAAIWGSAQNTLILRSVLFSVFPLVAAVTSLKRRRLPLDRLSLRRPFFSQCYLTAPFALAISLASQVGRLAREGAKPAGEALAVLGIVWYLWVETAWFRRQLGAGRGRALLVALGSTALASFYCLAIGAVLIVLMGGLAH